MHFVSRAHSVLDGLVVATGGNVAQTVCPRSTCSGACVLFGVRGKQPRTWWSVHLLPIIGLCACVCGRVVCDCDGGAQTHLDTWILCVAIAFHKLWAAMALGFKLENASKPIDEDEERRNDRGNMLLPVEADKKDMLQTLDSPTPRFDHVHKLHRVAGGGCICGDYVAFIVGFAVLAAVAAAT
uniref:Uncharacterized protein n=1 Tax=Lotharella globosa TaxID=91324 RepID=A0A7S4DGF1_9EUKA